MSKENKIIKVENLYAIYNEGNDNQILALTNINYEFEKNKIYCIIGNSGSGKSTLVTHFNGLLKAKYGLVKTNIVDIGLPYNLNDIEFLPLEYCNSSNINAHYFVVNQYSLSTNLIKIAIESIYKTKVVKIKKVKILQNIKFIIVEVIFDPNYSINIKKYNIDFILNYLQHKQINKPTIKQKWNNRKIKKFKPLRREIGMVFQFPEYQLFKETIEKDISFGPIALGINKDVAKQRAKIYLNKLGMGDEYLNRSPFGLSGGQKRRVAIAGILAIETPVLIFDEPTAGLDPVGEQEMLNIILDAKNDNKTVFVITHTMDHVLEIADEVILMDNGEIIASGHPYDIFTNKELINSTNLNLPKVIKIINDLTLKHEDFKKLLETRPRTIEELAIEINKLL